jgi:hypothetical protein
MQVCAGHWPCRSTRFPDLGLRQSARRILLCNPAAICYPPPADSWGSTVAKTTTRGSKEIGPPDPRDSNGAFCRWLLEQPPEWSVTIAARAALRVIPLLNRIAHQSDTVLTTLRANAIARSVARYPEPTLWTEALADGAAEAAVYNARKAAFAAVSAVDARDAALTAADVVTSGTLDLVARNAAEAAVFAARNAAAAANSDARAVAAYNAARARARAADAAVTNVVQDDAKRLHGRATTSAQLAAAPLWPSLPPSPIGGAWQGLAQELRRHGDHWSVWIDWYDDVLAGTPRSEAEEAAFTDIPGRLPWRAGADAVNTEIARRLAEIRRDQKPAEISDQSPTSERNRRPIATIISDLAEVASPQPALTSRGQLDAIPNRAFDLPSADNDLSTLPIRQSNLIKIILSDLPS